MGGSQSAPSRSTNSIIPDLAEKKADSGLEARFDVLRNERSSMKFGIFDHMDRAGGPLGAQYQDRLTLIEAYDRAGFYAYHVAEHHSTPLGMAPAPSVFLAAIALRTRRLRFGPLVYQLPLHHPLRLMEEISMLDHLSGGRLEVGIGRGAVAYEIEYYGVDPQDAQARYLEAYEVLLKAMTSRTLTHTGKYYTFKDVPIEIAPLQQPHPPLWYGAVSAEGAAWAAKNRVNIVCNAPTPLVRSIIAHYRGEWLKAGNAIGGIPLMGMNRYLVLADTDQEANDIARRAYEHWRRNFYYLWDKRGGKPPHIAAIYPDTFEEIEQRGYGVAGTPERVRETLMAQVAEAGNNYMICRFAFGDLSLAESLRSLALFQQSVMPALAEMRAAAE
jgi:alkanesulfonate monooxygenase SsuD/methylene tetrahydromethanopterin reductase-like flavin-dependent oxidoreductase (luciferase family)